ncbi:MAG: gamma-glutamyltransferase [Gammaproteobacteria bacterium]
MKNQVAIASSSVLAAEAGAEIVHAGGNAVDAAIAAAAVSMNTEPGVCSLGCGGYITVRAPGEAALTYDGYVAVPGAGRLPDPQDRVAVPVHLEYGGGVDTVVGPDTIAVPGGIALLDAASRAYGTLPWQTVLEPAVEITRRGFPLPAASFHYLEYSGEPIFGRSADGRQALHHPDGRLKAAGENIVVPHLADTLERIGRMGAADFYTGELGRAMAKFVQAQGGRLNEQDLASYAVLERPSLVTRLGDWEIATNPPPAVGGAVLSAMLNLMGQSPELAWDEAGLNRLIQVQRAVLGYRRVRLDLSDNLAGDAERLLTAAGAGDLRSLLESGSTCHTSAVDSNGLACSITLSAGYGSGDMPPGTGIWLNNCLGELELNKRGLEPGAPGSRLPSNMAPSTAVNSHGEVLAIGSPGADRITTALLQTLVNYFLLGMSLQEAIQHPRLHVEFNDADYRVACEEGLAIAANQPVRHFPGQSMFFGGVGATAWHPETGFEVAADPRRSGGTWTSSN